MNSVFFAIITALALHQAFACRVTLQQGQWRDFDLEYYNGNSSVADSFSRTDAVPIVKTEVNYGEGPQARHLETDNLCDENNTLIVFKEILFNSLGYDNCSHFPEGIHRTSKIISYPDDVCDKIIQKIGRVYSELKVVMYGETTDLISVTLAIEYPPIKGPEEFLYVYIDPRNVQYPPNSWWKRIESRREGNLFEYKKDIPKDSLIRLNYTVQRRESHWLIVEWPNMFHGSVLLCDTTENTQHGSILALVRDFIGMPLGCSVLAGQKKSGVHISNSFTKRRLIFDKRVTPHTIRILFNVWADNGEKLISGDLYVEPPPLPSGSFERFMLTAMDLLSPTVDRFFDL